MNTNRKLMIIAQAIHDANPHISMTEAMFIARYDVLHLTNVVHGQY